MRAAISIQGPWLATRCADSGEAGQLERSNSDRSVSGMKRVLAADELIALGSRQCRLTISVSAGEMIFWTSGMIGSIGCDADWLGFSYADR